MWHISLRAYTNSADHFKDLISKDRVKYEALRLDSALRGNSKSELALLLQVFEQERMSEEKTYNEKFDKTAYL